MFHVLSLSKRTILGTLAALLALPIAASTVPFTNDHVKPTGFNCASVLPPHVVGGMSCMWTTNTTLQTHIH